MRRSAQSLNALFTYFVRGLLLVVPLVLTVYIISLSLNFIDGLIGTRIPGLGFLFLIMSITFLGYLGSTLLIRSVFDFTERLITKLPLINTIYSALKELVAALIGSKKKFDKPVLVVLNKEAQLCKLGFITHQDLASIHMSECIAVYVPHSYNFSGDLFIFPRDVVTPLDIASVDVMKFIISGGVTNV